MPRRVRPSASLRKTSVPGGSLIVRSTPLFVSLLSHLLPRQWPFWRRPGFALAVAGAQRRWSRLFSAVRWRALCTANQNSRIRYEFHDDHTTPHCRCIRYRQLDPHQHPSSSFEAHHCVALLASNHTASGIGEFHLFEKNIDTFLATSEFHIFSRNCEPGSLTPSYFISLHTIVRWKRGSVRKSPMAPWHRKRIGLG